MTKKQKPFLATDCKKCEKFYWSKYKEPCCSVYKMILADTNKPYCKKMCGQSMSKIKIIINELPLHTCKDCIWFSTEILMGRNDRPHCLIDYTLVKPDYPQCERFAFNYGELE